MSRPPAPLNLWQPAAARARRLVLLLASATCVGCGPNGVQPARTPSATFTPPPAVGTETDLLRYAEADAAAFEHDLLDRLEPGVSEAVDRARAAAVMLEYSASASDARSGARRVASGVVISDDGEVLSVRVDPPPADGPSIWARDVSGRRVVATWVAADPETGLTLLKIAPGLAIPATPSPRKARLGLAVLVVGNPFGLGHSVSRGSVSGLNRRLGLGPRQLGGLIQVDAAIHPGDSGALLADLRGHWLGVIRSSLATPAADREAKEPGRDTDGEHDLGFAIPADDALWVASRLREHQRVDRAYLGVGWASGHLPPEGEGEGKGKSKSEGVLLARVEPDTPADRAGVKAGDRIVALDGHPIHSPNDLTDRLDRTAAGAEVAVSLLRGDAPHRDRLALTVHTGPRPAPPEKNKPAPDKDKDKPERARPDPPPPPGSPDRIERLERRLKELERELRDLRKGRAADVARKS